MSTTQQTPGTKTAHSPVIIPIHEPVVLHGVRYDEYLSLRCDESNNHLRMTYYDGTLELMSPEFLHERPARRIGILIAIVASELGIPCEGSRSTTIHRGEKGRKKGSGKEPDESFYFANAHRILDNESINLEVDPPPDLWIEVDNRSSSRGRLPVYAAFGVPEVWRYNARSRRLWFGRLTGDGTYEAIENGLSLPMLTPALIVEALSLGKSLTETAWIRLLGDWIRAKLVPPPADL
jgi:Uma2 family endonuclease